MLTDDRIFTMELVVTTPESKFESGATVRTVCRDLSGQVCWERVAQGFSDSVKPELLPDCLVYIEDQNLLIQTTALQSVLPIYSANVQALDADTGDLVWSASLDDGPNASGIFELKFDKKRNQVLALIEDYGPLGPGVAAVDAATGAVNWEAAFQSSFERAYIWSWDFAPDQDLLFVGFGVGPVCCVPFDIRLYTVNLNDGSWQFNNSISQEDALSMDMAASPDGQSYALALGRAPFAQILHVDGPSEQLLWRTSVPQSTEWEQPSVTFEPDGSSILAGYSRRGLVNSPTQTPAARFLRLDAGSGQIQWVDTDEGPQGTFSGNARGPHFVEVNDTDHLRSFTRDLALDKHVQVRQRVRNSDGAILATDVADAGGPGALHWQELGVDPSGTAWSLVQVPLPLQQPSLFFPSVALAHWPADLSGAYAFEFLALDGLVNELLDSSSGSPSGELSAAVMRWEQSQLRVAVVEVATGQQRLSVKLPGGAQAQNHVIRFSEDEQTLAVRGQGVAYEQIPPNDLTVLSAQDGTILWERELPTPLSTLLPTAYYPN
ncbi:MAG: outer membrane protein assembly factor BamB family protein, partial [Planctomycetota bacterium]